MSRGSGGRFTGPISTRQTGECRPRKVHTHPGCGSAGAEGRPGLGPSLATAQGMDTGRSPPWAGRVVDVTWWTGTRAQRGVCDTEAHALQHSALPRGHFW